MRTLLPRGVLLGWPWSHRASPQCEIFIDTETESHSNIPTYVKQNPFSPSERAHRVVLRDPDSDTEDGEPQAVPSTAELARRLDGRYQTNIVSLVASGVPIAGFVRVTAPKGRTVPVLHGGLTMELKTAFCTADEEASREVYEENIVLMGGGEVAAGASMDVPFAFLGPAAEPLDESFEGDLFSIRHTVSLTIARPWYTFPVVTTCPVLVQRVHDLRAVLPRAGNGSEAHGAGLPLSDASMGGSSSRAPMQPLAPDLVKQSDGGLRSALAPLEVAVTGLPGATKAALSLSRALYEVGDSVRGTVSFGPPARTAASLLYTPTTRRSPCQAQRRPSFFSSWPWCGSRKRTVRRQTRSFLTSPSSTHGGGGCARRGERP
jgi:hypothetical protein